MTAVVSVMNDEFILIEPSVTSMVEINSSDMAVEVIEDSAVTIALSKETVVNKFVEMESQFTLFAVDNLIDLVEVGIQGPQGISEEDMVYTKRVDFINDSLIYRGEATPGSSDSSPVWRIHKLTIGIDGDITETWANGDSKFDQIWDNRLSLTYL